MEHRLNCIHTRDVVTSRAEFYIRGLVDHGKYRKTLVMVMQVIIRILLPFASWLAHSPAIEEMPLEMDNGSRGIPTSSE